MKHNGQLDHEPVELGQACPRAAYIHVPFCRHRCGYCNFTVLAGRDDIVNDYLRAVELELNRLHGPQEVETLYFGGGTPTHLQQEPLRRLVAAVDRFHPLAANYEWTVEANPSDISRPLLADLCQMGVNRLSLGGQSFRVPKLRLLERDHSPEEIAKSVDAAHAMGLAVSLDLIFGAPGETLAEWQADLDAAIELSPVHVSTYGLTYERGTEFWSRRRRGELSEIEEDVQREMYTVAIDRLSAAGYEHYEVSNFARAGFRSRHNQVYWSGEGYFAAGAGASRYVEGVRETNHRSTTTYIKRMLAGDSPVAEREQLSAEARAREFLVFSLRRLEGVSHDLFFERTGYAIHELVASQLRKFTALGLLRDDGERVCLTREGLLISDAIWPEML